MVDAFARCEQVTRLYWCWLTDKMHSVEAGVTQAGALRYDGTPIPLTDAFHATAEAHAPAGSLVRDLRIDVQSAVLGPETREATLDIVLSNRSETPVAGRACLELPAGITSTMDAFDFELGSGQELKRAAALHIGPLPETANHVFLRVEAAGQVHYGWGVVSAPKPLTLDAEGIPGVSYLPDIAAVQGFLTQYGDDCAIVVGPGTGHWDTELGYRIKIILESLRGHAVPIKTWFMIQDVWDRPLIIVWASPTQLHRSDCGGRTRGRTPRGHADTRARVRTGHRKTIR